MSERPDVFDRALSVSIDYAVRAYEYGKRDSALALFNTILNRAADLEIARAKLGCEKKSVVLSPETIRRIVEATGIEVEDGKD